MSNKSNRNKNLLIIGMACVIAFFLALFFGFSSFLGSITGGGSLFGGSSGGCPACDSCCDGGTPGGGIAGYCTDSDNGNKPLVYGVCHDSDGSHADECIGGWLSGSTSVKEWYCYNNQCVESTYDCPEGGFCASGACSEPDNCQEFCLNMNPKYYPWTAGVPANDEVSCRGAEAAACNVYQQLGYFQWYSENGCCCYYCYEN